MWSMNGITCRNCSHDGDEKSYTTVDASDIMNQNEHGVCKYISECGLFPRSVSDEI